MVGVDLVVACSLNLGRSPQGGVASSGFECSTHPRRTRCHRSPQGRVAGSGSGPATASTWPAPKSCRPCAGSRALALSARPTRGEPDATGHHKAGSRALALVQPRRPHGPRQRAAAHARGRWLWSGPGCGPRLDLVWLRFASGLVRCLLCCRVWLCPPGFWLASGVIGFGSCSACLGFGSVRGSPSRSAGWRIWFWWIVVCAGGPVAGFCGCGRVVVWGVQAVAAVRMLFNPPVVVMDFVVAVPADHDQVVEAGCAAFGVGGDVVGLAHACGCCAVEAAAVGGEQGLPLRVGDCSA